MNAAMGWDDSLAAMIDADHTLCWNTDPDPWREAVTAWLKARVPR